MGREKSWIQRNIQAWTSVALQGAELPKSVMRVGVHPAQTQQRLPRTAPQTHAQNTGPNPKAEEGAPPETPQTHTKQPP